jgi:aarF domain-containing kinase
VPQDHLLPEEYVVTMRQHMLDRCPVSSYAEVRQMIQEDLGAPPEQLFKQFSETPIASASLAQVGGFVVSDTAWTSDVA